jgi:hypothetical protein
MPRKKRAAVSADPIEAPATDTAAADTHSPHTAVADPTDERQDQPKQWAKPYRAFLSCSEKGFEVGEDFRFKQVMFRFDDDPGRDVTQKLKDAGFKYRPNEKSWTISASAASRELAQQLANEFMGASQSMSR